MNNKIDTLTFDIPLIIRMMELAREDLKGDIIIHTITQKLLELSQHHDILTMDIYPEIEKLLPSKQQDINIREQALIDRLKALSGIKLTLKS